MVRFKAVPKKSLRAKLSNATSLHGCADSYQSVQYVTVSVQMVRKIGSHPLFLHPAVPLLNDLQGAIAEFITTSPSGVRTFESICAHVSKLWHTLHRANGSTYEGDPREAVLANLHYRPNQLRLFRRDLSVPNGWRVTTSIEDARDQPCTSDPSSSEENAAEQPQPDEYQPEEEQDEGDSGVDGDLSADEDEYHAPARPREGVNGAIEVLPLTDLQNLISEAILAHGGTATYDLIYDHVNKHRKKLRGRDGQPKNTDAKRAILASLSKHINSQPLFARDPDKLGSWMLGAFNPHYHRPPGATLPTDANDSRQSPVIMPDGPSSTPGTPNAPSAPDEERITSRGVAVAMSSPDVSIENGNSASSLSVAGSPLRKRPSPAPTNVPPLTDMQKLLIIIIHEHGGSCAFGTLVDEVSKMASKLKRRDGSHYSSDCGRAVKASLSNNTYSSPIFRRDPVQPDSWVVADRSFTETALADVSFMGGLNLSVLKRKHSLEPQQPQQTARQSVTVNSQLEVAAVVNSTPSPSPVAEKMCVPKSAHPQLPGLSHAFSAPLMSESNILPPVLIADMIDGKRFRPIK